jgi:hypothetical protein
MIFLEDSNGENRTPWKKNTVSKKELIVYFYGSTSGLRLKADNSPQFPDEDGQVQLQEDETYIVQVPPKGMLSTWTEISQTASSFPLLSLAFNLVLFFKVDPIKTFVRRV